MREKCSNRLVSGPDYMVDALIHSNQARRVSGESPQTSVSYRCPDGTKHLFCWLILAVSSQSLASNCPVVDSRYLNLGFGPTEATHNKLFISSPSKYTVEPSWMLVRVWPPIELLHRALTTIVFAIYYRMLPISHPQSSFTLEIGRFHSVWSRFRRSKFDLSIFFFLVCVFVAPKHRAPF
ncbi:hypothetical protein TNCV_2448261 [Trichonephila clavipes]|uniref:Uncharacterized protein n=1 Tax=Trichonephila clavipes TaxID=2585209 RepID=A0A8X6VMZ7_TRICX|nr:hypothetical protein TNCV_2448261 [Trichonephila clavipes]